MKLVKNVIRDAQGRIAGTEEKHQAEARDVAQAVALEIINRLRAPGYKLWLPTRVTLTPRTVSPYPGVTLEEVQALLPEELQRHWPAGLYAEPIHIYRAAD